MISYEVSLGLIIIGIIISTGSMNLTAIVEAQRGDYGLLNWYWLPHLPMVVLFFVSALAECNRPPFDLVEAESELVAGFMTEYSSTPYLLFMAGEYIAMYLMCALLSLLFFGGCCRRCRSSPTAGGGWSSRCGSGSTCSPWSRRSCRATATTS